MDVSVWGLYFMTFHSFYQNAICRRSIYFFFWKVIVAEW